MKVRFACQAGPCQRAERPASYCRCDLVALHDIGRYVEPECRLRHTASGLKLAPKERLTQALVAGLASMSLHDHPF